MAVKILPFGIMPDGRAVEKIVLENEAGTAVSVLTYGATVQALLFRGKDIVLGFDALESYFPSTAYIGATVGRVANRIADGKFTLNGTQYVLNCNEFARGTHLHGGNVGFDRRVWAYAVKTEEPASVCFSLHSPDGEEGYPGNLEVQVTLTLSAEDTLTFDYAAVCDRDTPINLTNHTYFNLNGCDGAPVDNTRMRIAAEEFTPVDERLLPTGGYQSVAGTPLDLRRDTPLSQVFASTDPLVAEIGGIDHNYVLSREGRPFSEAVWAYSPDTGIRMTCLTDLPGVQIYTGNATDEPAGKYGCCWGRHQGFCVETQYFPDSVNQETFPSIILKAGERFASRTAYHFELIEE